MEALGTTSIQSNIKTIPVFYKVRNVNKIIRQAIVDECDLERCLQKTPWRLHVSGYAVSNADGKSLLMHRFIVGCVDSNLHVHHIDGNRLNNARSNLSVIHRALHHSLENSGIHTQTGSRTKYFGVTYNKASHKWRAFVYNRNRQFFIGSFNTAEEAALAYNEYVIRCNLPRRLNVLT